MHSQEEASAIRRKYLGVVSARLEVSAHEVAKLLPDTGLQSEDPDLMLDTLGGGPSSSSAPAPAPVDPLSGAWLHVAVELLTAAGEERGEGRAFYYLPAREEGGPPSRRSGFFWRWW